MKDARVNGSIIAWLGENGTAEIWDYMTEQKLASLQVLKSTANFDVIEEYIAFGARSRRKVTLYYLRESLAKRM